MKHELDEIDIKIIRALEEDGRISYADLYQKIGIAESTLRRRLKKLQGDNIARVTAVSDPRNFGFNFICHMRLQAKIDTLRMIGYELAKDPHVLYLTFTTGEWDILALLAFRTPDELATFIWKKMKSYPDIIKTDTIANIEIVKSTLNANPGILQIIESEKIAEKKSSDIKNRTKTKERKKRSPK